MEEMITIRELLASIVWKWKKVLAATICMAVLLGVVQEARLLMSQKADPEETEEAYAEALEDYQRNLAELTKQQGEAALALEQAEDYIDRSLLMRLNPYDVFVYTTLYTVRAEDGGADTVTMLCRNYAAYWAYGTAPMELSDTEYADTEEKYVRELVSVQAEGGVLCVTVEGAAEEVCYQLSAVVESYLAGETEKMAVYEQPHKLERIEAGMHRQANSALALAQSDARKRVTEQKERLKDLDKQVKGLKEPERPITSIADPANAKSVVKYAVVGGFIGLILAGLLILWESIAGKRVENSLQAERVLKIPFLGNISHSERKTDRLYQKISGERAWKTPDTALSYAVDRICCGNRGKARILLACADTVDGTQHSLTELTARLEKQGIHAESVAAFNQNPETGDILDRCDAVVIVGRAHQSRLNDLAEIVFYVEQTGKTVTGFIMA